MWVLFGVKPLKYLDFEWSGIEKSEDWLSYFNESCSVSHFLVRVGTLLSCNSLVRAA